MSESTKIPKGKLHLGKAKPRIINKKRFQTKEIQFSQYPGGAIGLNDALKACKYSYSVKKLHIGEMKLSEKMGFLLERTKNLRSLRSLGIGFEHYDLKTNFALDELSKGLRRFDRHRKFSLSCALGEEGIKSLGSALKRLGSLEEINFIFYMCKDIGDSGYKKLGQGLKECKSLRIMTLCLDGCEKITVKGFDHISRAISNFASLASLELILRSDGDTDANIDLKSLSESFEGLVSLREIYLHLTGFQSLKDEDMSFLKEGLKKLRLVQSLRLDFGESENIRDFGITEICEAFIELESLKFLDLKFMNCENITDEGLEALGKAFEKMNGLEHVLLTLRRCPGITKARTDELQKELQEQKKIKASIKYY